MQPTNYFIFSKRDFNTRGAAQTRMMYYAKALRTDTDKVYLLSTSQGKIESGTFREVEKNIFVSTNTKKARSPLDKLRFVIRMFRFAHRKEAGSIFIFYPTKYFFHEFAAVGYLKWLKKQKIFFELNEVRRYSAQVHGKYSLRKPLFSAKKWVFTMMADLSTQLLRYYDGILCISTTIEEYAWKHNANTFRIPILTDSNKEKPNSDRIFRESDQFNIGFAGSVYHTKENFNEFIDVVLKLDAEGYNVAFNICGSITWRYKKKFLERCDAHDCLNYYGVLGEADLSAFLSQQDLLVLPRGFTLQNHYGFSTKLSDYLNHGKVILVTDTSDVSLYIKDGVNGFVVPPDDMEAMLEKLKYIIDHFESLHASVEKEAQFTSRNSFDYRKYATSLRSFLLKDAADR